MTEKGAGGLATGTCARSVASPVSGHRHAAMPLTARGGPRRHGGALGNGRVLDALSLVEPDAALGPRPSPRWLVTWSLDLPW